MRGLRFLSRTARPLRQHQRCDRTHRTHRLVVTENHRLTLRYNYSDADAVNAASVGGPREQRTTNALGQNGNELDTLHFGTAQLTSVFSPTIINEVRFTGSAEERPRTANSETPTVTSTIGAYGARSFLPTVQNDRRLNAKHSIDHSRLAFVPHGRRFQLAQRIAALRLQSVRRVFDRWQRYQQASRHPDRARRGRQSLR